MKKEFHKKLRSLVPNIRDGELGSTSSIYMNKLEGKIEEDFWQEQHAHLTDELQGLRRIIEAYDKTNESYMESGVQFLELANKAPRLYAQQRA